jgi:hypothetical protein
LANFAPIREAVIGYRAHMIAQGFNERVAEQMALQFHGLLLANVGKSVGVTG